MTRATLGKMTVAALRGLAEDRGLDAPSSAKKAELVELIVAAQDAPAEPEPAAPQPTGTVAIVCPGPSLAHTDLDQVRARFETVIACDQAAATVAADYWIVAAKSGLVGITPLDPDGELRAITNQAFLDHDQLRWPAQFRKPWARFFATWRPSEAIEAKLEGIAWRGLSATAAMVLAADELGAQSVLLLGADNEASVSEELAGLFAGDTSVPRHPREQRRATILVVTVARALGLEIEGSPPWAEGG